MGDCYDRRGHPISINEWTVLFEDPTYQRVAYYEGGGYKVSTVWLGLDHGWGSDSPIIFETLVLRGVDEPEFMRRYSTEKDALDGHAEIISMLESAPLEDLHESSGDRE